MLRHTLFTILTNLFVLSLGLVRFPFLTRVLGIEEFGHVSFVIASTSLFGTMFTLGLDQFLLRTLSEDERTYQDDGTLFLDILFSVAAISALCSFLLYAFLMAFSFLAVAEAMVTSIAVWVAALFYAVIAYYYGHKRLYSYNLWILLKNALWLVLAVLIWAIYEAISPLQVVTSWALGLSITTSFAIGAIIWIERVSSPFTLKHFLKCERLVTVGKGLRYGLPLLSSTIGVWSIDWINRYFLGNSGGGQDVALFTVAYMPYQVIFVALSGFSVALLPYFLGLSNSEDRSRLQASVLYVSLSLALMLSILVTAFSSEIIGLLAGTEYQVAGQYMWILAPLPMILIMEAITRQDILYDKRTIRVGQAYLVGMTVSVLVDLLLIPHWGISGATIAVVLSFATAFIFVLIASGRAQYYLRHMAAGTLPILGLILSSLAMIGALVIFRSADLNWLLSAIASSVIFLLIQVVTGYQLITAATRQAGMGFQDLS